MHRTKVLGTAISFGFLFVILATAGCSQGGGGNSPSKPSPNDALKIYGNIEIEPEAGRGDPEESLMNWYGDCVGADYKKMGVKPGTQISVTENLLFRKVSGDWVQFDWSSNYVIDQVEQFHLFVSGEHAGASQFAKVKYRVWSGQTWVEKRALEVTESSDEKVRAHFTKEPTIRDCRAKFGREVVATYWATYTLSSGRKVSGIVRKESAPMENYKCSTVDEDGLPRDTLLIAEKATEQLLTFYTKELLNPLEGFCIRAPTLLTSYSIINDKGEVVELRKNEVTSIK